MLILICLLFSNFQFFLLSLLYNTYGHFSLKFSQKLLDLGLWNLWQFCLFLWKCNNLWWLPPGVCELRSLLAIFYIVIVSVSMNSILSISIIKHILLIIFCNDDRDQMLWGYWHVVLYVILFNCKMPMQVLFQIKFIPNRCLVTSWEHRHSPYWSTWWFDCVHSFPSVWVIS